MGQIWGPDPVPSGPPQRRKRPKYGGEMDALLDVIYANDTDHLEKVEAVERMYPHMPAKAVSAFVFDARRALLKQDTAHAERLTHKFIATAHRSAPEFEPEPRRSWWGRFWPWLAFVYAPTTLLLGACEVWK